MIAEAKVFKIKFISLQCMTIRIFRKGYHNQTKPPSEPVASFEKFEQVLQYLENEDKEIILLGDINYDLLRIHNRPDPFASDNGDHYRYCRTNRIIY